jgi:hypothetical protein
MPTSPLTRTLLRDASPFQQTLPWWPECDTFEYCRVNLAEALIDCAPGAVASEAKRSTLAAVSFCSIFPGAARLPFPRDEAAVVVFC